MCKEKKMSDAAIEARREYQRKYYATNKERRKEYAVKHWEKAAERAKEHAGDNNVN